MEEIPQGWFTCSSASFFFMIQILTFCAASETRHVHSLVIRVSLDT
jgi:hypothetical protein